jgi:hypothetical protein
MVKQLNQGQKQAAKGLLDCSALEISDECRSLGQAMSENSTPLRDR